MQPTAIRMKMLKSGDVFNGLEKIRNKAQRRLEETHRHNEFMDMLGYKKVDPVKWSKGFIKKHGKERAVYIIENMMKDLANAGDHVLTRPYIESKTTRKNIIFYKNALAYIKNLDK